MKKMKPHALSLPKNLYVKRFPWRANSFYLMYIFEICHLERELFNDDYLVSFEYKVINCSVIYTDFF